jgi:hypothetical protein
MVISNGYVSDTIRHSRVTTAVKLKVVDIHRSRYYIIVELHHCQKRGPILEILMADERQVNCGNTQVPLRHFNLCRICVEWPLMFVKCCNGYYIYKVVAFSKRNIFHINSYIHMQQPFHAQFNKRVSVTCTIM